MTDQEFRDLVKRMRTEQKAYFRFRDQASLDRARAFESTVDRALANPQQGKLFTEPPARPLEPE